MAIGIIGIALGIGLLLKTVKDIDGTYKLVKSHTTKASANKHLKQLKSKGKEAKIIKGKNKKKKTVYGVYVKVKTEYL